MGKKAAFPMLTLNKYELGAMVELPVLVCQFRLGGRGGGGVCMCIG